MYPQFVLAAPLAGVLLVPASPSQDLVPEEGQPFPEIIFSTLDGGTASRANFRGEKGAWVVLSAGVEGACFFLRRDFTLPLLLRPAK